MNKDRAREINARRDAILQWLVDEEPYVFIDQKHLDAGTSERAYWHMGYQQALTDVLRKSGLPSSERTDDDGQ